MNYPSSKNFKSIIKSNVKNQKTTPSQLKILPVSRPNEELQIVTAFESSEEITS